VEEHSAMHKLSGLWTHQGILFTANRSELYALVCPILLTIYALHWAVPLFKYCRL